MASTWDPDQYNRFRTQRRQPFLDLMALLRPREGLRVVDLGCGTGETTRLLHDHLGARETLGLDSSETMLADSAAYAAPGVRFERGDIAAFTGGAWDVVLSNAALQWLPDHPALFARVTAALAPDGQLAVQMPYNYDEPSHTVAAALAREEPFRTALGGYAVDRPVQAPEAYAALLFALGYREQRVGMQVYAHVLPSPDDVVEWVKGTLLTAYRRRLPAALWPAFLEQYRTRLLPQLNPAQPYFYPFKRLLMWAQR
ncbi:MAG: methyltransferase domain-containing protein [Candidatus Binatia bacterium]